MKVVRTHTISEAGGVPLTDIEGVAITRSGDLWVGQDMDGRIARYGPEGDFRGTIGRRGPGPGEFNDLEDVFSRGDSVLVVDGDNRSTSVFFRGELVDIWRAFMFPDDERAVPSPPDGAFADGSLLIRRRVLAREADPESPLARFHPEHGFRNVITTAYEGQSLLQATDEDSGLRIFYHAAISDSDLWRVVPGRNEIVLVRRPWPEDGEATAEVRLITNRGDLIRTIRLKAEARRVLDEPFDSLLNWYADRSTHNRPFPRDLVLRMYRDATPKPDWLPLIDRVYVDACRRIWLRRSAFGQTEAEWLVYSWTGDEVGRTRLPATSRPAASTRDALWVEARLTMNEPVLHRYEVSPAGCRSSQSS